MLLIFALLYLFPFFIESAFAISQMVELSISSTEFTQTQIYTARMKTGHSPPNRFLTKEYYKLEDEVCDGQTLMSFTIVGITYNCPINDDLYVQEFNQTHVFDCPTFCQVCKEDMKCLRSSYSDIFFTPDGRSIDNITFHYGILDKVEEREINYFIFWAYLFIFSVGTLVVAYAFTE